MSIDLSDAEADFKAFLIAEPDLAALHGGRVYYRIPDSPVYPLLRLYRTGGGKQPGEPPVRDIRIAVEVLGGKFSDYEAVRSLTTTLESVIDALDNVTEGQTLFMNGIATGVVDKPDPDTGWPGRVVDCLVTCRSV